MYADSRQYRQNGRSHDRTQRSSQRQLVQGLKDRERRRIHDATLDVLVHHLSSLPGYATVAAERTYFHGQLCVELDALAIPVDSDELHCYEVKYDPVLREKAEHQAYRTMVHLERFHGIDPARWRFTLATPVVRGVKGPLHDASIHALRNAQVVGVNLQPLVPRCHHLSGYFRREVARCVTCEAQLNNRTGAGHKYSEEMFAYATAR